MAARRECGPEEFWSYGIIRMIVKQVNEIKPNPRNEDSFKFLNSMNTQCYFDKDIHNYITISFPQEFWSTSASKWMAAQLPPRAALAVQLLLA